MARTEPRAGRDIPPARAAALEALNRTLRGMDLQAALDAVLARADMSAQDTGLATELVYGALRKWERIEYILSTFLKNPGKLPKDVRLTMLTAGYEILHLDRIPAYASVDWAVERVKRAAPRLSGLANAVLRKTAKLGDALSDPAFFGRPGEDPAVVLGRRHSAPAWLARLWLREYGPERAEKYLAAQSEPPALGVRLNPGHPEAEALRERLSGHPDLLMTDGRYGFAFPSGTSAADLGLGFPGPAVRLSFGAQQALDALGLNDWPEPVWDCCAGRGGKTRQVAETGKTVLASDPHHGRLKALKREFQNAGLPDIPVFRTRADTPPPLTKAVGTVLVDAPCSGLGVLSRRPDAKRKRSPADLKALAELQGSILQNAWETLRPGGLLAYVTCTLNPDENERLIEHFVRNTSGAALQTAWSTPPESPLNEFFWCALIRKG